MSITGPKHVAPAPQASLAPLAGVVSIEMVSPPVVGGTCASMTVGCEVVGPLPAASVVTEHPEGGHAASTLPDVGASTVATSCVAVSVDGCSFAVAEASFVTVPPALGVLT
jgi:hypothetical protein